ncbi:MAG: hypothetical protein VB934_14335 [Polyangiaceae bacterium]
MSLKDKVVSETMKLAAHPAVAPILQDERFMKLLLAALSMPGKITELSEEQRLNVIRVLGLATAEEVANLTRTVRSLEDELAELRTQRDS